MRGLLIIREDRGSRVEELPKAAMYLAFDLSGYLILQHPGCVTRAFACLEWTETQAGWSFAPVGDATESGTILWRGMSCPRQILLNDGDSLQIGPVTVWFRMETAPPVFRGASCLDIPLQSVQQLCFGRALDAAKPGEEMVLLDAEDRKISRRHISLRREGDGFMVRDESPIGAFLNGQRFETHRLAVGDRFQVGHYSFEFTGISLRRTRSMIGGEVEADGVGYEVGGRTIIRDVTLRIEQCSFTGILGGSGQGKSTLLNALCGINPASEGSVLMDGSPIAAAGLHTTGIGFVPQDDIVHPELRVEEAVLFSARLRLDPRVPVRFLQVLVKETISRLGLDEHRRKRIFQLSGGQRKRVSIATELLDKPSVLFLDEPSSGLDPATEFALMKILRGLAAHDCTVICTTHVLGRAYLFDKIVFIHGGRVIFDGTPAQACEYFQVEALDQVYLRLAEEGRTGDEWAESFAGSGVEAAYVPPAVPEIDGLAVVSGQPEQRRRPGFFRALRVLLERQWSILAADKLNVLFLLAQPILIALLVGWVAEDYVLRMFLCVVAALWFGCSNGAQQIIKELPVFRRERVCGLGLNSYLFGKYLFLGAITSFQALLLLMIVQTTSHIVRPQAISPQEMQAELLALTSPRLAAAPLTADEAGFEAVDFDRPGQGPATASATPVAPKKSLVPPGLTLWPAALAGWFFELRWNLRDAVEFGGRSLASVLATTMFLKFLALAATAVVGVAIGLTISGLVQNSAQAVMWVPLLLIPQILFGGVVLSLPELSRGARAVCAVIPSFSCQRLMDVSNVYGQAQPLLSNRTRIPLFLTPGEKQTLEWKLFDRDYSESYDRLSPFNTSWQNLVVFPQAVGRHRNAYTEVLTSAGSKKRIYNETTETRDDVKYSKGRVFLNPAPVGASLLVLGGWLVVCYGSTLAALALRQKGK